MPSFAELMSIHSLIKVDGDSGGGGGGRDGVGGAGTELRQLHTGVQVMK